MRKILFVLVAVLLIASTAQAAEWTQAVTAEYAARNQGRAIATDSSVVIKIWADPGYAANPGVGVSASTAIIAYWNFVTGAGATINTQATGTDTVGEVVDYINTNFASDSSVRLHASVGNDAYRAMAASTLVPANIIACGTTKADTTSTVLKQTNDRITVGCEAKDGVVNRIKSLNAHLDLLPNANGASGVTLRIYDGNTLVWRKFVGQAVWNTATDPSNSGNTVTFPEGKGISSTSGNGLVAECVVDTQQPNSVTAERAGTGISIIYDELRD